MAAAVTDASCGSDGDDTGVTVVMLLAVLPRDSSGVAMVYR